MTTTDTQHPTTPSSIDTVGAIVVATDGSERSRAALDWAAAQAAASGRPLHLVTVEDEIVFPVPYPIIIDRERLVALHEEAAARIHRRHPEVTVRRQIATGTPVHRLVEIAATEHQLVVGKRGLGPFGRMLIGSTSIAVAGRSTVPVVIVPDDWDQASHATGPVVVGVDPEDPSEELLRHGFAQAQARGVGVTVVHGITIHPVLAGEPGLTDRIYADWSARAGDRLNDAIAPFRAEFADVEVEVVIERGHPGAVLLEHSGAAQLLVLGRHRENRVAGFAFSSVTRGVLHYAKLPVAVVPA